MSYIVVNIFSESPEIRHIILQKSDIRNTSKRGNLRDILNKLYFLSD